MLVAVDRGTGQVLGEREIPADEGGHLGRCIGRMS
jgi:hypothetical protein